MGEIVCVQRDKAPRLKKEKTLPEKGVVEKTLYVKEQFNVSNQAYHELSMINLDLPRSYEITKKAKEIDAKSYTFYPWESSWCTTIYITAIKNNISPLGKT